MIKQNSSKVILFIVGIIISSSLGVTSGFNPLSPPQTMSENVLFDEIIHFEYNETYQEKVISFNLTYANLSILNELVISFNVTGDKSSEDGIEIVFEFNTISLPFLIERTEQIGEMSEKKNNFILDTEYIGELNFSLIFKGNALSGENGTLNLFTNSKINQLTIPSIDESPTEISVYPEHIEMKGSAYQTLEDQVKTVFINPSENFNALQLNLSFTTNEFNAFESSVAINIGNTTTKYQDFESNIENNLFFEISSEQGLNTLIINFQYGITLDDLKASNISLECKMVESSIDGEDVYAEIHWSAGLDEEVNLTPFKPSETDNEHVLHITLVYSCIGSKIASGISFQIAQKLNILYSAVIDSAEQNEEPTTLEINAFTYSYQDPLILKLQGVSLGEGYFNIHYSTQIETDSINHIDNDTIEKILETQTIMQNAILGRTTLEFYDVIYVENNSLQFTWECTMEIQDQGNSPFDSFIIDLYINQEFILTETYKQSNFVNISKDVNLRYGYNESKLVLSLVGQDSEVEVSNIKYSIESNKEPIEDEKLNFEIPLFKTPTNIGIGLFVLFDSWLIMGIILRVYRGFKKRKKGTAENDEYILEIAEIEIDS